MKGTDAGAERDARRYCQTLRSDHTDGLRSDGTGMVLAMGGHVWPTLSSLLALHDRHGAQAG